MGDILLSTRTMCLLPSLLCFCVFLFLVSCHIVCFCSAADGTTAPFIIAVTVVIMLVIVVGVVILVVIFRVKTRKQRLEINKLQKTTEKEDIEMKLKQKESDIDADLSADQPLYAEIQTEASPQVPSHSEEHLEYLNQNSTLTEYNEIELEQADSKHTHPAMPLRQVKLSNSCSKEMESVLCVKISTHESSHHY